MGGLFDNKPLEDYIFHFFLTNCSCTFTFVINHFAFPELIPSGGNTDFIRSL